MARPPRQYTRPAHRGAWQRRPRRPKRSWPVTRNALSPSARSFLVRPVLPRVAENSPRSGGVRAGQTALRAGRGGAQPTGGTRLVPAATRGAGWHDPARRRPLRGGGAAPTNPPPEPPRQAPRRPPRGAPRPSEGRFATARSSAVP